MKTTSLERGHRGFFTAAHTHSKLWATGHTPGWQAVSVSSAPGSAFAEAVLYSNLCRARKNGSQSAMMIGFWFHAF